MNIFDKFYMDRWSYFVVMVKPREITGRRFDADCRAKWLEFKANESNKVSATLLIAI